ncbi:MAG: ROK family protein [Chitinophagaceae bacterium]|nr:MAG: ROK family protein [Chitinophagaceae bacterium]
MNTLLVLGADIGGSHISTSLVNINEGLPVAGSGVRLELNSRGTATEILSTCSAAIRQSLASLNGKHVPVGIAMPGPFDYDNGVSLIRDQDKFRALYQLDMKNELASLLSIDASLIHFMNDACAFLEGEILGGAVKSEYNVMGITLGTGLGSAFRAEGDVQDADLWCAPYKNGIAEDYLSTRWFAGRYEELTGKKITGVKELTQLEGEERIIAEIFTEFAENLGGFIASQYNLHGYNNIVIGGNIAKASGLFVPHLNSYLGEHANGAKYCLSSLGENAALTGAAGMAGKHSKRFVETAEKQG